MTTFLSAICPFRAYAPFAEYPDVCTSVPSAFNVAPSPFVYRPCPSAPVVPTEPPVRTTMPRVPACAPVPQSALLETATPDARMVALRSSARRPLLPSPATTEPPVRRITPPSCANTASRLVATAEMAVSVAVMVDALPPAPVPWANRPEAFGPVAVTLDAGAMVMLPPLSACAAWAPSPPVSRVSGPVLVMMPPSCAYRA